jgi:hypothetical protein
MFAVNNIVTRRPPVRPPNGTRPASAPHPSEGGSRGRGYAQEMQDQVISLWKNGADLNAVWIELLRRGDASAAATTTGIVVRGQ